MFIFHIYDRIAKIILFLASFILDIFILLQLPEEGSSSPEAILIGIIIFALLFFCLFLPILRPLSTKIYCAKKLGIHLSFSEAKKFSQLFSPLTSRMWYPMQETLNYPVVDRVKILEEKLTKVEKQNNERQNFIKNLQPHWKALRILISCLMFGTILGAYLDIWPLSLLNTFQIYIFNGYYYPILSALPVFVLFAIPLGYLEKKLKIPPQK